MTIFDPDQGPGKIPNFTKIKNFEKSEKWPILPILTKMIQKWIILVASEISEKAISNLGN